MKRTPFADRADAGRQLARHLETYRNHPDAIVLALPRGGVPVGYEVARELHLPLDVFLVRKLGVPGFEELAMGAIASGGARVVNQDVLAEVPSAQAVLENVIAREAAELERREREYRDGRPPPDLRGRIAILVDDGLATGATMRAAVKALRGREVAKIIVAVPVGSPESCRELGQLVDEAICAEAPIWFHAVGQYYADFSQTTDEEVRELLATAARAEETRSGKKLSSDSKPGT